MRTAALENLARILISANIPKPPILGPPCQPRKGAGV